MALAMRKLLTGLVLGAYNLLLFALYLGGFGVACYAAFQVRIYAIKNYGYVIHEFDPWFNYRATEYLGKHGWSAFFKWFDYKVWYPLGRPVGTTIYPGMQITAVGIWKLLGYAASIFNNKKMALSLNDVCCLVPAWFGMSASVFLGLLTAECSGSWSSGTFAALIMSIVPAHIMRSVAGGFDNECVALTAMCMTFFLWCRALRHDPRVTDGGATTDSYLFGALSGLAYVYMVAAWGGFVFVLNMVGFHAAALVILGRYTSKLHRAYTLFYFIGTAGATRVPVVGWGPLKSLEQLAALGVFLGFQLLEYCEVQRRKRNLTTLQTMLLRVKLAIPAIAAVVGVCALLYPTGYFGPLTARVRGLFVKHTRTGNPLVDSVAEHQPANEQAYQHYLHNIYHVAPIGFGLSLLQWTDANLFIILYAMVAYYFSNKMARLIILLGPVASALGGVAFGFSADQLLLSSVRKMALKMLGGESTTDDKEEDAAEEDEDKKESESKDKKTKEKKEAKEAKKAGGKKKKASGVDLTEASNHFKALLDLAQELFNMVYNNRAILVLRVAVGVYLAMQAWPKGVEFYEYSHQLAEGLSQPQIMFKAKLYNGQEVMVDDYREAYWWLRDHTPEDARVMSWWDYGYQITGIGERTTIADGNTWNHEHIATLGLILSGSQEKAHSIARHLADYVLVWAGGGGDDLAKSPHMARIGNSVYRDICPGDPTCSSFGFYQGGTPTPMMEQCLLYKLVQYGRQGIKVNESLFKHVYTTKYGKVRIFKILRVSKKSKDWVADPKNRVCDAPGSWYCTGQYPPALAPLIAKRKNFAQLEDFNAKKDDYASRYQEEYHKRMDGLKGGRGGGSSKSLNIRYVGCFDAESQLGPDKTYVGGDYGSSVELAKSFAKEGGYKYFAVARTDTDGHVFAFSSLARPPKSSDAGCEQPCLDNENYNCGCADELCGGLKPGKGEANVRRWATYEVLTKKKGSKRSAKTEL